MPGIEARKLVCYITVCSICIYIAIFNKEYLANWILGMGDKSQS